MFATNTGNPVLNEHTFDYNQALPATGTMTIEGTINKTFILLFLVVVGALFVWANPIKYLPFMMPIGILTLIMAVVIAFKHNLVGYIAPAYAVMQGAFLGVVSSLLEKQFPGIAVQAVGGTMGTLFCILLAYRSGYIKATQKFKLIVMSATGALMLIYLVSFIMSMFGKNMGFITGGGIIGIGFSIFVCGLAAMNLVLDFDMIEQGVEQRAPSYMEWYGAFALMVTLVWLYIEILRLLAKLRSDKDR